MTKPVGRADDRRAQLISTRRGLEAIERAVKNTPPEGYAASPPRWIEQVAHQITWPDGEHWASGAAFGDIGATLAQHLPLGKDGVGWLRVALEGSGASVGCPEHAKGASRAGEPRRWSRRLRGEG